MAYRRRRDFSWVLVVLIVLVIAVSAYFQLQGAIQCNEGGGEYLRGWSGWPVCVGEK